MHQEMRDNGESRHRAFEATIHGRVQGVGFRFNTRRAARNYGVAGYVQNQPDGTVTVVCEGPADAVEKMKQWVHKGPPGAGVTGVDLRARPYRGQFATFTIEH